MSEYKEVLIYDPDTGEVFHDLSGDWDLTIPSHRVRFSKMWRECGCPDIDPGALATLGAPPDFLPVPVRPELSPLALDALQRAMDSSDAVEWAARVEKPAALSGSAISWTGRATANGPSTLARPSGSAAQLETLLLDMRFSTCDLKGR